VQWRLDPAPVPRHVTLGSRGQREHRSQVVRSGRSVCSVCSGRSCTAALSLDHRRFTLTGEKKWDPEMLQIQPPLQGKSMGMLAAERSSQYSALCRRCC
jgi:hypothetical protein